MKYFKRLIVFIGFNTPINDDALQKNKYLLIQISL